MTGYRSPWMDDELELFRDAARRFVQNEIVPHDARWREQRNAVLQESCRVFALAHAATNAAQRESAARRLRAYARDLQELAAQR